MGKKHYQGQSKFAKRAGQAKKKRHQKPNEPQNVTMAVTESEVSSETVQAPPVRKLRSDTPASSISHPYVASDLIHTLIIAAVAFVILLILYFAL